MVALDSSYLIPSQATGISSFYTVYCQIYSDFKSFDDKWQQSWIYPQKKETNKMETAFFSHLAICEKKTII